MDRVSMNAISPLQRGVAPPPFHSCTLYIVWLFDTIPCKLYIANPIPPIPSRARDLGLKVPAPALDPGLQASGPEASRSRHWAMGLGPQARALGIWHQALGSVGLCRAPGPWAPGRGLWAVG